ncbi:heme ABC exporter ATP-binding protein CcmA [Gluconobacter cerinus]|uniref:Cytochrome C biogenesis protein CcmA n=1 Tax=Gluconobacter cerinus TaxID=38307 RepID=A0A1B6VLN3_9PROT|nr:MULTISPECIES: heme ABC exporter ATP-binding protein CcmA [Gluconobacter]MBS1017520.1 heme ABC exporter ATP-binding protein CcmA [Gluconobacter cerinus]MBS1038174.1 heme ABC exporter ATP-binding protein CcmA [Gluconobacter cerinus]MBS1039798.1 heme ABC exporter ATP-binding protein CcmA [Gluconobacter cerinus]MBS1046027.1 heme ABC exporter ATP-binding protein CcmA [Gluconobacter cerinus]MBS1069169.1 heme ABC exporter ATP-binding protein CcmA [Gluconobacter cerinus]
MTTQPPDPTTPSVLLDVRDITVFRGDRLVLDDVSLSLAHGDAMILTGPNGAGKSTLLRTIAGLRKPDGGTIERYGALAWLGHQDALKPGLTLAQNLALADRLGSGSMEDVLEALDLAFLTDLPARLLSSGQKRRAAFARVMLSGAPLWLLDEPTVGLDVASIERLGAIMAKHRDNGGAMIVTTHVPLPLDNTRSHELPSLAHAEPLWLS